MNLIYLACPHSHHDPAVRQYRFDKANKAAGYLMRNGYHVFSPISHSHSIAEANPDLPSNWSYYRDFDLRFLNIADELVVLTLQGWRESTGVQAEITHMRERRKPIRHIYRTSDDQYIHWHPSN